MILDNINKIRYCIRAAAQRAGRNPEDVALLAVTKYADISQIRELLESGLVAEIGENRIQAIEARKNELGALALKVKWRLIGHLQTNKAKKAVELCDTVDSLDSLRLAAVLDKAAAQNNKRLPVLVQIKLTAKETQSGIMAQDLEGFLKDLKAFKNLEAQGLMAIAPQAGTAEELRPHFRSMRQLFERFFSDQPQARLSMGMSQDFETAVEEGSTMVRLGSVIFSQ